MAAQTDSGALVPLPEGLYPYGRGRRLPKPDKSVRRLDLGVVIILDALGFKGIWSRENAGAVLKCMRALRRTGVELQGADKGGALLVDTGLRHRVRCMSDTIVVTVIVRGPNAPMRGLYKAMLSGVMIAGSIIFDALGRTPALLFRGCVAAGRMKEDMDFLIGPAVDEAAERFEKADGPFLWLAPSALDVCRRYEATYLERIEQTLMVPYRLPLNNGAWAKTRVFTHFCVTQDKEARMKTRQRILEAFGNNVLAPSVEQKRENVVKFFEHVERIAESGGWKKNRPAFRWPDWEDLSPAQRLRLAVHRAQTKKTEP